ncbi:NYN domain-containing protein [Tissierella creatinini]|nr:NYN domain-containing protein [Tissierella creatinini]TJX64659.1 NYN domain-containing protein [Soehngenia saccharolytica]
MEEKRFAVLIDADNVSAKYIKYIFDEIANYGVATYKRIYGDWTKPNVAAWKDVLLENSVTPVQQYSYTIGKNATDSAMIIDAMDILYSGYVEGYCIVSSDSDFTKLSSRLRESGMLVVGMGERKTPKPFISACNHFKYLDVLANTEVTSIEENIPAKDSSKNNILLTDKQTSSNANGDAEKSMTDIEVIKMAIIKLLNEVDSEDQKMNLGEIGNRLAKRYPDFDVRNYGDTKLSKFLKKFDFLDIMPDEKGGTAMWVSMKQEKSKIQHQGNIRTVKKRKYKKKSNLNKNIGN